jgi:antitoxin (DNA-binding transcriptional repressor) of toxin-antitoxin stability system
MISKTVDIVEAQTNLPELVSLVNTGIEVVLTKNCEPVACLVPMESSPALTSDRQAGVSSNWLGCLEHLHVTVTEEDIAAARHEMWADFPRNLP